MAVTIPADAVREGTYGDRVVAVEPGGAGFIPLAERHGRPLQLFWTWASPNLEFATVFVGVLAVPSSGSASGRRWPRSCSAPRSARSRTGVLSARGPAHGVPQMVLSRHRLRLPRQHPAGRAERGHRRHRLVRGQQRQRRARPEHADRPAQGASAWSSSSRSSSASRSSGTTSCRRSSGTRSRSSRSSSSSPRSTILDQDRHRGRRRRTGSLGGFLLTVGATFGYAAGWNPYASDYTRYLPPGHQPDGPPAGAAGLGVFVSCVLLETVGAGVGDDRRAARARRPDRRLHRPPARRSRRTSPCSRSRSARSRPTR